MADQDYPNLYEDMEASAQRTRAAAIAFEHVIGGPEDDMVPVNGYPAQPTIAGRVKTRLEPLIDQIQDRVDGIVDTVESAAESVKRFAGVHAVAPPTRYDGTPLQPGDEYQNSASGLRYSWNGSSWVVLNASVQQLTQQLADEVDPAAGAATVGRAWQIFRSVADLRSFKKTSPSKFAETLDFYNNLKGGGALYWYDASDTTSAESIPLVIVANDGSRLKLNHNGDIRLRQAGAKGDGIANDSPAVNAVALATGRVNVTEPGWFRITEQIPLPTMDKLEIFGTVVGAGLKVDLPDNTYLVDNSSSTGDSAIHVHDLNMDFVNIKSKVFRVVSTIKTAIFENLYLQHANDVWEFEDLFSHPTIRNVIIRSIGTGQPTAGVLKTKNCNTVLVDGLSCTGSWGGNVLDLAAGATGNENYSMNLSNIIVQGTAGKQCGRALNVKGGTLMLGGTFYTEQSSAVDTIYLEDVKVGVIENAHMTFGSIKAKNCNLSAEVISFMLQAGNVAQLVSDNSNITINNLWDLNDYLYRFERPSSGRITVNNGTHRSSKSFEMSKLGNGGAFGAATVAANTVFTTAGIGEAYDITVTGQAAGFSNGMTMFLPNTKDLPVGTELTAIIRINKKSGTAVRVQAVASDFTVVYPLPVTSFQTSNGWRDLVIHLKKVDTGFNGNIRIALDGDGAVMVAGRLYLGWVTP